MIDPQQPAPVRFCGRRFAVEELEWTRPGGGLKNHECRQLLEQLRDQGWLTLPELRKLGPRGPRRVRLTEGSAPQPELGGGAGDYEPLRLSLVAPGEDSARWCEWIERYHYLGYRVPVGAQLRYRVRSEGHGDPVLACL